MFTSHVGEFAALLTALFWTVTALAFENATTKVGTYAVNIIRLLIGFVFLVVLAWFNRGILFPIDATWQTWFWLFVSGIVGLVIGDLFLFASYPIISSRIAMLIMTLAPPIAALMSWFILGEKMGIKAIFGMLLVIVGISLTIWSRKNSDKKMKLNYSLRGLVYAFIGTLGQASGLVLSKLGMGKYNAFASTQIRLIAGIIGFTVLISILKKWKNVGNAFKNRQAMKSITIGSFFGPFLGISFSLIAIQNTSTGIASTLMAIVPILLIPPAIFIFKQKVSPKEIIGAFISVCGVALFFI
jgi:drug/metabolite transporter (DMT)-like permease